MSEPVAFALALTVLAPLVSVIVLGFRVLLGARPVSESLAAMVIGAGLVLSMIGGLVTLACFAGVLGEPVRRRDRVRALAAAARLPDSGSAAGGLHLRDAVAVCRAADGAGREILPHVSPQGARASSASSSCSASSPRGRSWSHWPAHSNSSSRGGNSSACRRPCSSGSSMNGPSRSDRRSAPLPRIDCRTPACCSPRSPRSSCSGRRGSR